MTTIQLIVTGDLEELALSGLLARLLGLAPDDPSIRWQTTKVIGFTSREVAPRLPADVSLETPCVELFLHAMEAFERSARRASGLLEPDLVVVVDDLEVSNWHQPCHVVEHARAAATWLVNQRSRQVAERFRSKVSFHLLHLMAENYLLADRHLTDLLNLPPHPGSSSDDPEFIVDQTNIAWAEACEQRDLEKSRIAPYWRERLHAKHWLLEQLKTAGTPRLYREKNQGAAAMAALQAEALWKQTHHCSFLAALVHDVADFCGVSLPDSVGTQPSSWTWPFQRHLPPPAGRVLRNL